MHPKSSSTDPVSRHLSALCLLRQRRKSRDLQNRFVIEGIRQFVQACDAQFRFDTILVSLILLRHSLTQKLVRRLAAQGTTRVVLSPEQFRGVSTTERASGIAAIVQQRWTRLAEVDPDRGLGFLIVDHIRSSGNLGTILRTAEAVGMGGVFFVDDACDPYDPCVVRASMGGIFHLPLVRTRPRELSLWLAANNVQAVGLSPHAQHLWTDGPVASRYAIALGEEREGLSSPLRRLCDTELRLPMSGRADSLNVAIAAGVMMYELARRRVISQTRT